VRGERVESSRASRLAARVASHHILVGDNTFTPGSRSSEER